MIELNLIRRDEQGRYGRYGERGSDTVDLGETLNKLTDLVRYINPHRRLPSVYTSAEDMSTEEMMQYVEGAG